VDQAIVSFRAK